MESSYVVIQFFEFITITLSLRLDFFSKQKDLRWDLNYRSLYPLGID